MGRATIFISGIVSQMPRYRDVQTKNGTRTVASFSVPADHGWGDRKETTFFECEHWMPDSDKGRNYLSHALGKGARVAIVGEPYRNEWTAKDGSTRTSIRVDVRDLDILQAAPSEEVKDEPQGGSNAPQNGSQDVYDDDIPF